MKDLASKELKSLFDYYEAHKRNQEILERRSIQNMVSYDIESGGIHYYRHTERSVEEQIQVVCLHKNKQYHWLLAETYEVFEDYLKSLYAYLGLLDNNLWPACDFGNITFKEIAAKNFDWYLQQRAREKKDNPAGILNHFRKIFPELVEIENKNYFKINLRLSITLIEKLRHQIVHCSGTVADRTAFCQKVMKKAGLSQNGEDAKHHLGFVNSLFCWRPV